MSAHRPTALVTGAARRLGRALAEALLADGWAVAAHVHYDGDAVPDGATRLVGDLADPAVAGRLFDGVAAAGLGPVQLLVNNASLFDDDRFGAVDAALFDRAMAINVRAPLLLIDQLARRHRDGLAQVINITDGRLAAPNADHLSYGLSKAALAGLTEVAARSLAGQGIRVNAIAPAMILPSGEMDEAAFAVRRAFNPLGHPLGVEDVVAAMRSLVAATAITGQTLYVDGGQRFWSLPRDIAFVEPQ